MDKLSTKTSALERAERILVRRPPEAPPALSAPQRAGQQATPVEAGGDTTRRADAMLGHLGRALSGRGLLRAAAYGYVALAANVEALVDPVRQAWQQSVDEARQEQERQADRAGGTPAGRREAAEEKRGEQTLKTTAGGAAEAAGTAGEAAGA